MKSIKKTVEGGNQCVNLFTFLLPRAEYLRVTMKEGVIIRNQSSYRWMKNDKMKLTDVSSTIAPKLVFSLLFRI